MPDQININVALAVWLVPGDRASSGEIVVSGTADESFLNAVERSIRQQLAGEPVLPIAGIEWSDPESDERLMQIITDDLTVGHVAAYFESEIEKRPATITLSEAGYGGDFDPGYIIEIGLQVAGAVSVVRSTLLVQRAAIRLRNRKRRGYAKEWNDTGRIPEDLKDDVLNKGSWPRRDFDLTYGLGNVRGPELLRILGFQQKFYESFEMWERDPEQSEEV